MENASKALIIAGGLFLAMMILVMIIGLITNISSWSESKDRNKLMEQIQEFNNSYLAYNKSRMYGTDVLTVYHKAENDNKKYEDDPADNIYKIKIEAQDKNGNTIAIENTHEFKVSVFECLEDKTTYNNETGRINKMVFRKTK